MVLFDIPGVLCSVAFLTSFTILLHGGPTTVCLPFYLRCASLLPRSTELSRAPSPSWCGHENPHSVIILNSFAVY